MDLDTLKFQQPESTSHINILGGDSIVYFCVHVVKQPSRAALYVLDRPALDVVVYLHALHD